MTKERKDKIRALLGEIETGEEAPLAVINEDRYIQHNPQTHEGGEGLAVLFKRLAKTSPRVNIVRIFSDGDFVFAHTEYFFSRDRVGFEVFRFEGTQTVEHWDNIQSRKGPNPAGHSMVDGQTEVRDLELTEANRTTVRAFIDQVLIGGRHDRLDQFIDGRNFTEHNPSIDSLETLRSGLAETVPDGSRRIRYDRIHRLLADGNFVLSVSEGACQGIHTSFYDLFRVASGKLVEHWDTSEAIPPRSEWKNDNGKF